jgi:hypothetical protein
MFMNNCTSIIFYVRMVECPTGCGFSSGIINRHVFLRGCLAVYLRCKKISTHFKPHLSHVRHFNSAPKFATSKWILPHFYISLTSETYAAWEKSCHNCGYKPNTYLTRSDLRMVATRLRVRARERSYRRGRGESEPVDDAATARREWVISPHSHPCWSVPPSKDRWETGDALAEVRHWQEWGGGFRLV